MYETPTIKILAPKDMTKTIHADYLQSNIIFINTNINTTHSISINCKSLDT